MSTFSASAVTLYTSLQIRQLEQYTYQHQIATEDELMQRAGTAAFELLRQTWPQAGLIVVCCGHGNNAGDGYVLATLAQQSGRMVKVLCLDPKHRLSGPAAHAQTAALAAGVAVQAFDSAELLEADVIVDALLGIGLSGPVNDAFHTFIDAINLAPYPVLAIDGPSGLLADTGCLAGVAVKADHTVTFIGHKQGYYTAEGPEYCGQIHCADLGVPAEAFASVDSTVSLLDGSQLADLLPPRHRNAHKGDHGHALVIGGDYGMGGAVRMAAEAALRVGAGLVTVATRPEHVPVVSGSRPELMCQSVLKEEDIQELIDKCSVIVVGPGLGRTEWAEMLLAQVLHSSKPKVLDADALNLLANVPERRDDWIFTPHPGEAGRLLSTNSGSVQQDRFAACDLLQKTYGGVMVLKGAGTLIQNRDHRLRICAAGNPGMATGGMGDILSGVIGGLLAQGLSLEAAAQAGVYVHARAADIAAEIGGERGLLATDLLAHLRELVNPDQDS